MNEITLFQAITLAVAVIGAALGLINTWHMIDRTQVKLRVSLGRAMLIGGGIEGGPDIGIEVTNLSSFPVTLSEVGVNYKGTNERGVFIQPLFADHGVMPRRLEPRSSITAYGNTPDPIPGHPIRCAYAKTQCGVVGTGVSPALKAIVREQASQS